MRQRKAWISVAQGLVGLLLLALICVGGTFAWWGVHLQLPAAASIPVAGVPTNPAAILHPTAQLLPTPSALSTPSALPKAPRPAPVATAPNVRVSAGRFSAHSEVALAQNPRNRDNLVGASKMFTDNANYVFRVGTYATFDGGATWIDNGQLPRLEHFEVTSDPTVVFDSAGSAYVEVLAANRRHHTSSLYIYKSTDGGRTWSEPMLVSDDVRGFNDKQWLAVDTSSGIDHGTLYTAWVQIAGEAYRILFARSADGGATWSEPQVLAGAEHVVRHGPVVTVGAGGEVSVLWSNLTHGYFESSISHNGGRGFGTTRRGLPFRNVKRLNGNLRRSFVLAGLAADPRKSGVLYLVWDDGRHGDADILFSVSTNGGVTWQEPVVLTGDTHNDQFQPWVAVNPHGDIFVQWFDRRDDPANLRVHTYAARSQDSGRTWSELRITDVAADPTVGLPMVGNVGFYGDYQSLVADTDRVYLFWNETRDGTQEIYSATVGQERWAQSYSVPDAEMITPPRQAQREAAD